MTLAALRERHAPVEHPNGPGEFCGYCSIGQYEAPWPCDAARLLLVAEGAAAVKDCFDRGEFQRNTDADASPDWAIKAARPLAALATMVQALMELELARP